MGVSVAMLLQVVKVVEVALFPKSFTASTDIYKKTFAQTTFFLYNLVVSLNFRIFAAIFIAVRYGVTFQETPYINLADKHRDCP